MSKPLIVPNNYKSQLDLNQTEKAIKLVKDTFQQQLSAELEFAQGHCTFVCSERYRYQ